MIVESTKKVLDTLQRLTFSDAFYHSTRWTWYKANNKTKHIDSHQLEYILDGLQHHRRYNSDWEPRKEFTDRFLKVLVDRGEVDLLVGALLETIYDHRPGGISNEQDG